MLVPCGMPGQARYGEFSVGLALDTSAVIWLLLASHQPLFSGLVSAPGAVPSFFMQPNITAIAIMINSLANCVIHSFQGRVLNPKLQIPLVATPALPCLPGRCVYVRGVVGVHKNWGHPEWRERNPCFRKCVWGNLPDCLNPPLSGSRACWV